MGAVRSVSLADTVSRCSASRDRARLRLAGPRSLRSRGRRCAPRPSVLAESGDVHGASCRELGRRSLPVTEAASPFLSPPGSRLRHRASGVDGQVIHNCPPRSPLPPSACSRLPSVAVRYRGAPSLTVRSVHRSAQPRPPSGRPRRSRLASLATDHSGHAGALRTVRARSGLK